MAQPAERRDDFAVREFTPVARSERGGTEPLLGGLVGPPGGGKTASMLRIAEGIRRVRGGRIVLADTEAGRSRKYSPRPGEAADPSRLTFDFDRYDFEPPYRFHEAWAWIAEQIRKKPTPAVVCVDSLSDFQEGEGGHLDWHNQEVARVGGNDWAAWAKPSASRRRFVSGILHTNVPLLFTFRAREKTAQEDDTREGRKGRKVVVNLGWMPVAPLEVIHALDFTCILPPRADGKPVWTSDKLGEEFIIKRPGWLDAAFRSPQLTEEVGEALARWQLGESLTVTPVKDAAQGLREEIMALLHKHHPGDSAAAKKSRLDLVAGHCGAATWKAFSGLDSRRLRAGLDDLQRHLEGPPVGHLFDDANAEADEERAAIQAGA